MPNNTNPQAILFSNNYGRTLADDMASCYLSMKRWRQVWNAQNLGAVIPDDANLIQDGATVASGTADGRNPITNGDLNRLRDDMDTLIAAYEASTNTLLNHALKVAVNSKSVVT